MTEQLNQPLEQLPAPEQHEALPTPEQAEPLRPGEADPRQRAEQARQQLAETTSGSTAAEALKAAEQAADRPQPPATGLLSREARKVSLNRELKHLQRQLPPASRAISRLVHQPVIRQLSQVSAQTIGRPSGLLGGGLVALLGSTGYLLFAQHYGYTYNYLLSSLLFVAGFIIGLLLESLIWLTRRRRGLD